MGGYFSHSLPIVCVFLEFVAVAVSIFASFRCRNSVSFTHLFRAHRLLTGMNESLQNNNNKFNRNHNWHVKMEITNVLLWLMVYDSDLSLLFLFVIHWFLAVCKNIEYYTADRDVDIRMC